jgi:hypothetical protein
MVVTESSQHFYQYKDCSSTIELAKVFSTHPGINKKGRFELFGDDGNYTYDRDDAATLHAFKLARQARFEHGETPHFADRRR